MWRWLSMAVMAAGILYSSRAQADPWFEVVSYTCDLKKDEIVIEFQGAANEAGEALETKKGPNAWDPLSLFSMRDKNHIGKLIWVQRQCHLSDGKYTVAISAAPENFNIQGRCGESIGAQATVSFEGFIVLAQDFGQPCTHPDGPAYREFIIHDSRTHEITLIPTRASLYP